MWMVFQVCFFVGIGLSVISFVLGHLTDLIGVDGFDFSGIGIEISLPLSPVLFMMFATIFGGVGMILMKEERTLPMFFIIAISIAAGFTIVFLVNRFILKPLKKAQNTSAPELDELIGIEAKVTESIKEGGFGEITYIIHGNSYAAPAKSTKKEAVQAGSKVSICWIEDNVFYVTNIDF